MASEEPVRPSSKSRESIDGAIGALERLNSEKPGSLEHPPVLTRKEQKQLWRKVDLRLMPVVVVMYLCSFLDRANIGEGVDLQSYSRRLSCLTGNAKLQGLVTQLDLTGNRYNIALVCVASLIRYTPVLTE